jgi:hypothetical protein
MSVYLEMQIDEMADEITALKAINQKIQLEKNALKEQFSLQGVSQQSELLIGFFDWYMNTYAGYDFSNINLNEDLDDYLKTI